MPQREVTGRRDEQLWSDEHRVQEKLKHVTAETYEICRRRGISDPEAYIRMMYMVDYDGKSSIWSLMEHFQVQPGADKEYVAVAYIETVLVGDVTSEDAARAILGKPIGHILDICRHRRLPVEGYVIGYQKATDGRHIAAYAVRQVYPVRGDIIPMNPTEFLHWEMEHRERMRQAISEHRMRSEWAKSRRKRMALVAALRRADSRAYRRLEHQPCSCSDSAEAAPVPVSRSSGRYLWADLATRTVSAEPPGRIVFGRTTLRVLRRTRRR